MKPEEFLLEEIKKERLNGLSLRDISKKIPDSKGNAETAKYYLLKLQKNGYILWNQERKKIVLMSKLIKQNIKSNILRIPFLGEANCGEALCYAEDKIERYIEVSSPILKNKDPKDLIIVRAIGDSMNLEEINGKKIEDGDLIIVDKNEPDNIENGDCILSVTNGLANIKIYNKVIDNDYIKLSPNSSNKNHFPIFVHKDEMFTVTGKIVEVIKK
ncbi:hypothetical protein EOM09_06095 [bacterium]|nr:hypothetical protein [bacterium]